MQGGAQACSETRMLAKNGRSVPNGRAIELGIDPTDYHW
jgi:hypothetical protein